MPLGLDPCYRRLFVDYMREYAKAENKTVFLTSHIIQDMERLIDDCIIMDYGKILVQMPVEELLGKFRRYTTQVEADFKLKDTEGIYNPSVIRSSMELFSMLPEEEPLHNGFVALRVFHTAAGKILAKLAIVSHHCHLNFVDLFSFMLL